MIHTWEKTKKKSCLTHEINSISNFKTMNILCILGGGEGEQHICYCSHTKRNLSERESTMLYGQINKNLLSYYNIMVITWINYALGDSNLYTNNKTSNIAVVTNMIKRSSGKTNKNKQTTGLWNDIYISKLFPFNVFTRKKMVHSLMTWQKWARISSLWWEKK